ncbi:hypothetical protein EX30DRAFT_370983 [Ascodesmis nigricans]|uniref:Uncharacterized protein n=1 Tax=Ascodesmis nigricans TaxID=341454 RepID=A0A4S2MZW6_9PEZI|nr:hypothetical protein EX30DRAFT_370983 [Ascodesmis nigricans]
MTTPPHARTTTPPTAPRTPSPLSLPPSSSDPSTTTTLPSSTPWTPLTPHEIATLSIPTLRLKLSLANTLIQQLQSTLSTLSTSFAHQSLQQELLYLETAEARARYQVEAEITAAQVEVLKNEGRRLRGEVEGLKWGEGVRGLGALGEVAERVLRGEGGYQGEGYQEGETGRRETRYAEEEESQQQQVMYQGEYQQLGSQGQLHQNQHHQQQQPQNHHHHHQDRDHYRHHDQHQHQHHQPPPPPPPQLEPSPTSYHHHHHHRHHHHHHQNPPLPQSHQHHYPPPPATPATPLISLPSPTPRSPITPRHNPALNTFLSSGTPVLPPPTASTPLPAPSISAATIELSKLLSPATITTSNTNFPSNAASTDSPTTTSRRRKRRRSRDDTISVSGGEEGGEGGRKRVVAEVEGGAVRMGGSPGKR